MGRLEYVCVAMQNAHQGSATRDGKGPCNGMGFVTNNDASWNTRGMGVEVGAGMVLGRFLLVDDGEVMCSKELTEPGSEGCCWCNFIWTCTATPTTSMIV